MYCCAINRASADPFREATALLSILAAGRDDEEIDDEDEDDESDATLIRVPGMDEALDDDPDEYSNDDDDTPVDDDEDVLQASAPQH